MKSKQNKKKPKFFLETTRSSNVVYRGLEKFFVEQYIGAVYLWSLAYFSSLEEIFGWIRDDEKDSFWKIKHK